jgi:hypothetical protein
MECGSSQQGYQLSQTALISDVVHAWQREKGASEFLTPICLAAAGRLWDCDRATSPFFVADRKLQSSVGSLARGAATVRVTGRREAAIDGNNTTTQTQTR